MTKDNEKIKKRKGEKSKELLFQSALSLFKTRGFSGVTISDITRKAGMAKGNFYTYYSTKSDIIVEEFWRIDSYYREISSKILTYPTASRQLLAFTEKQMEYVQNTITCDLLKVLYANQVLQEGSDKVIVDKGRFWHTFIVHVIAEGQRTKEFHDDIDAETLATYFNRAIRGILLDWNIHSGDFDLVETSLHYCNQFIIRSLLLK